MHNKRSMTRIAFCTKQKGFTIPELLMVISIIAVVGALAFPFYNNFIGTAYAENATRDFVESLRRANSKARGSDQNAAWGVHRSGGSFVLFQGASWASRNATLDESHSIPSSLIFSGPTDYIFTKMGTTTTTGTTTITGTQGRALDVVVNAEGMISTQ